MSDNKTNLRLTRLRAVALVLILIGAIGSIGLTLYTGRKNSSMLLMTIFVIWVLSPFVGLYIADRISKHWYQVTRISLYVLMLFIPVISLIAYSGILNRPDTKPAFMFLLIPLVSWILIAIVITIAAILSRRKGSL